MATECLNCGTLEGTFHEHHVSYARDETVTVCEQCHLKIHKNRDHELYPEDTNGKKKIAVTVDDQTYENYKDKKGDRTWLEVIWDGVEAGGSGE